MTLSFREFIGGRPTFFPEKILQGIDNGNEYNLHHCRFPKIHTIRADPKKRWRVGMDIHFVIKNRTPQRYQFAPVMKVLAIQQIEIEWINGTKPCVVIDGGHFYNPIVGIDEGMIHLAINDGFDSLEKFFEYFRTDFTGIIIHWTKGLY